mgnify:CR=1 FL=1
MSKELLYFFTDGEPNHQSGFDESVANSAITSAKTIKQMQIFTPLVYLAVRMSALPGILEVDHGVLKKI